MSKVISTMIDPTDAVMLLIDHQSGLFQLVADMDELTLRNNVSVLAKVAHLGKIPTFTTASVPDGPNGPLIPEIHRFNPDAVHIPRTGQINAWDNPKWVEAIQKTVEEAFIPKDDVRVPFNPLLVNTGSKLVLFDTGFGDVGAPTQGQTELVRDPFGNKELGVKDLIRQGKNRVPRA